MRAGEGGAAAAGEEVEAERARVADDRAHLVVGDAELVGGDHGERGAQAADIRRARHQRHRAVLVHREGDARLAADVEPEARGDAPALPLVERRGVVIRLLDGVERFGEADGPELRAVGGLGALPRRVLEPQLHRIDLELLRDLVHHALDGELGDRRAGRPVGGDLRPVRDHVVADDLDVLDVVRRVRAHHAGLHGGAREGARLVLQLGEARDELAVLRRAHLDLACWRPRWGRRT